METPKKSQSSKLSSEMTPSAYGESHVTTLSKATQRELVHKRQIKCNGFARKDGLFDIEAELTDHKTYQFPSDFRGIVTPDLAVHHMILRVTIDKERVIKDAEAITISGPYAICPQANSIFNKLVGLQIGPGWRRTVQNTIGGIQGCTHITELLSPVATTAFQTLYGEEARQQRKTSQATDQDKKTSRPHLINSCVGYADSAKNNQN